MIVAARDPRRTYSLGTNGGPEFIAKELRKWLGKSWARRRCTSSLWSPWENEGGVLNEEFQREAER